VVQPIVVQPIVVQPIVIQPNVTVCKKRSNKQTHTVTTHSDDNISLLPLIVNNAATDCVVEKRNSNAALVGTKNARYKVDSKVTSHLEHSTDDVNDTNSCVASLPCKKPRWLTWFFGKTSRLQKVLSNENENEISSKI